MVCISPSSCFLSLRLWLLTILMRCGEMSAPTTRRSNGSEEAHVTVLKPWKSQNYLNVDFYIVKKKCLKWIFCLPEVGTLPGLYLFLYSHAGQKFVFPFWGFNSSTPLTPGVCTPAVPRLLATENSFLSRINYYNVQPSFEHCSLY